MKRYKATPLCPPTGLPRGIRRRKPRSYLEWKTLRRWRALPPWEEDSSGYLLRSVREDAGITQEEMGRRLGCTQQAVAQAERWDSNPTVLFLRAWARALGRELTISIDSDLPV